MPALLVIITLLIISSGVYVYESRKTEVPTVLDVGTRQADTPALPVSSQQNPTNKPANVTPATDLTKVIISSISKSSGPIGTAVELKGYNLLSNRGDQNLVIENSKGEVASFGFGNPEHLKPSEKYVRMNFTLSDRVCKQWETDMGGPCTKGWMTIVPGEYKIYVASNGFTDKSAMSNKVTFIVTAPSVSSYLVGFEQAVNSNNWTESQKYLADKVYVVLEGSSCCGEKSSSDAAQSLKSFQGIKLTFDKNSNLVKEYLDYINAQYPSGRKFGTIGKEVNFNDLVIGVENDPDQPYKATIGYKVENGKITLLFINPGRDR